MAPQETRRAEWRVRRVRNARRHRSGDHWPLSVVLFDCAVVLNARRHRSGDHSRSLTVFRTGAYPWPHQDTLWIQPSRIAAHCSDRANSLATRDFPLVMHRFCCQRPRTYSDSGVCDRERCFLAVLPAGACVPSRTTKAGGASSHPSTWFRETTFPAHGGQRSMTRRLSSGSRILSSFHLSSDVVRSSRKQRKTEY